MDKQSQKKNVGTWRRIKYTNIIVQFFRGEELHIYTRTRSKPKRIEVEIFLHCTTGRQVRRKINIDVKLCNRTTGALNCGKEMHGALKFGLRNSLGLSKKFAFPSRARSVHAHAALTPPPNQMQRKEKKREKKLRSMYSGED